MAARVGEIWGNRLGRRSLSVCTVRVQWCPREVDDRSTETGIYCELSDPALRSVAGGSTWGGYDVERWWTSSWFGSLWAASMLSVTPFHRRSGTDCPYVASTNPSLVPPPYNTQTLMQDSVWKFSYSHFSFPGMTLQEISYHHKAWNNCICLQQHFSQAFTAPVDYSSVYLIIISTHADFHWDPQWFPAYQ